MMSSILLSVARYVPVLPRPGSIDAPDVKELF